MKILQINSNYDRVGGAETVFHNTISLLKANGHNVISFTKRNINNHEITSDNFFIEPTKNKLKKIYWKDAAKRLQHIVQNEKPDVAHIHNIIGELSFSILRMLKRMNIPIVMTVHDFRLLCPTTNFLKKDSIVCEKCKYGKYYNCVKYSCSPGGFFKSIAVAGESYLRDMFLPFNNYVDYFIFPSQFIRKKFIEVFPEIENRCIKLHNFSPIFYPETTSKDYFLYMGRLAREKGLYTLIESFRHLPDKKLIIIGDGPDRIEIEKNSTPNILFKGYKKGAELESLVADAFFIIVPSEWYENNPMVIIEAYCHSKPIIGTSIGGIPEIVKEGVTGFLYTPKDVNGLSEVIMRCCSLKDDEYNHLSKNALEYSVVNFSPDSHYKKLIAIYESISKKYN